jgi:hypothetical protein
MISTIIRLSRKGKMVFGHNRLVGELEGDSKIIIISSRSEFTGSQAGAWEREKINIF